MRAAFVAAIFSAPAIAAHAAPVRHAGEWQTTIDNNPPATFCFQKEQAYDRDTIMPDMAQIPQAKCEIGDLTTTGPVTTYAMKCSVYGGVMTSSGTISETGLDSFTSKVHASGTTMTLPSGQKISVPPSDMTTSSRRIGARKPGDEVDPY